MTTKITGTLTTEISIKCKICDADILFDVEDSTSYVSKTEHQDFFGMQLKTYRVQHQVNGENHLNAVLIDSQNLFRGYIDAYKIPIQQAELQIDSTDFSKYCLLENEIEPLKPNTVFTNFLIVNLTGWILEVLKIESLKTDAVLKTIFDKIEETKNIYEIIPQPLTVTVANLDCFIWIENNTHLILTLQKNIDSDMFTSLLTQITKNLENSGIIPKKRIFGILVDILQEPELVEKRPDFIIRLLSDDLFYSKIRVKYPERLPDLIPKIAKRHSISKDILEDLLHGKYSLIELLSINPELTNQCKLIIETLDFINRRKLLD